MDRTVVLSLSLGFTLYELFRYFPFLFLCCLLILLGACVGRHDKLFLASLFSLYDRLSVDEELLQTPIWFKFRF